jgi:NADPH:quinone reductase-like Zn-dependent oxidoreductase
LDKQGVGHSSPLTIKTQIVGLRFERTSMLLEAGKVVPVIERRYPLGETAEAIRYLEEGHARGKVVITVDQNDNTSL